MGYTLAGTWTTGGTVQNKTMEMAQHFHYQSQEVGPWYSHPPLLMKGIVRFWTTIEGLSESHPRGPGTEIGEGEGVWKGTSFCFQILPGGSRHHTSGHRFASQRQINGTSHLKKIHTHCIVHVFVGMCACELL